MKAPEPHNGMIMVGGQLLTDQEALVLADHLRRVVEARDTARFLDQCRNRRLLRGA